MHLTIR